jgi:hypothetical protein
VQDDEYGFCLRIRKCLRSNEPALIENKSVLNGEDDTVTVRLYEIWPGKNQFNLDGRLLRGPASDKNSFIFTWFVILTTSITFGLAICPFLWNEVSIVIPCFYAYLFLSTVVFLLLTTFTEPGIIPHKSIINFNKRGGNRYYEFESDTQVREILMKIKRIRQYCDTC